MGIERVASNGSAAVNAAVANAHADKLELVRELLLGRALSEGDCWCLDVVSVLDGTKTLTSVQVQERLGVSRSTVRRQRAAYPGQDGTRVIPDAFPDQAAELLSCSFLACDRTAAPASRATVTAWTPGFTCEPPHAGVATAGSAARSAALSAVPSTIRQDESLSRGGPVDRSDSDPAAEHPQSGGDSEPEASDASGESSRPWGGRPLSLAEERLCRVVSVDAAGRIPAVDEESHQVGRWLSRATELRQAWLELHPGKVASVRGFAAGIATLVAAIGEEQTRVLLHRAARARGLRWCRWFRRDPRRAARCAAVIARLMEGHWQTGGAVPDGWLTPAEPVPLVRHGDPRPDPDARGSLTDWAIRQAIGRGRALELYLPRSVRDYLHDGGSNWLGTLARLRRGGWGRWTADGPLLDPDPDANDPWAQTVREATATGGTLETARPCGWILAELDAQTAEHLEGLQQLGKRRTDSGQQTLDAYRARILASIAAMNRAAEA